MSNGRKNGKGKGNVKRRIAVIGIGRFGSRLASELHNRGHDVLAIDAEAERVQDIKGHVSFAVIADATDAETMSELGVEQYDIGIVAIGGNEIASIMTAVLLKTYDMKVFARAHNQLHAETLERLGCDRIVRVEDEMGLKVAQTINSPNVDLIELGAGAVLAWLEVPAALDGKTIDEAEIDTLAAADPKSGDPRLVALRRSGERIVWAPEGHETLAKGDWVALAGGDAEAIVRSMDPEAS